MYSPLLGLPWFGHVLLFGAQLVQVFAWFLSRTSLIPLTLNLPFLTAPLGCSLRKKPIGYKNKAEQNLDQFQL